MPTHFAAHADAHFVLNKIVALRRYPALHFYYSKDCFLLRQSFWIRKHSNEIVFRQSLKMGLFLYLAKNYFLLILNN